MMKKSQVEEIDKNFPVPLFLIEIFVCCNLERNVTSLVQWKIFLR